MRLKRLISAFIACAMLATFMPMQAFAANDLSEPADYHESFDKDSLMEIDARATKSISIELGKTQELEGTLGRQDTWSTSDPDVVEIDWEWGAYTAKITALQMSDEPVIITHEYYNWVAVGKRTEQWEVTVTYPSAKFFVLKAAGNAPETGADQGINQYYPNDRDAIHVNGETYTAFTGLPGSLTQKGYEMISDPGEEYFALGKETPIDEELVTEPDDEVMEALYEAADLDDDQEIIWYVMKNQPDGYHVDGYVSNILVNVTYQASYPDGKTVTDRIDHALTGSDYSILSLDECEFETPVGYEFTGWELKDSDTDKTYRPGETFALRQAETFVAQWKEVKDPVESTTAYFYVLNPDFSGDPTTTDTKAFYYVGQGSIENPIEGEAEDQHYTVPTTAQSDLPNNIQTALGDNFENVVWYRVSQAEGANSNTPDAPEVESGLTWHVDGYLTAQLKVQAVDESGNSLSVTDWPNPKSVQVGTAYTVAVDKDDDATIQVPQKISSNQENYAYDPIVTDLSKLKGIMGEEDVSVNIVYSPDEIGGGTDGEMSDGIPDKYQAKVTFEVKNGTWSDGSTIITKVVTLVDESKKWSENGSYTLQEKEIPTAMNPNEGFENGSWDTDPADVEIDKDGATFTYTFTKETTPPVQTDWEISKSKTATNLDANYESQITLSLPAAGYERTMDVVFVLDDTHQGSGIFLDSVNALLNDLAAKTTMDVRVGIVAFDAVARDWLDATSQGEYSGLVSLKDEKALAALKKAADTKLDYGNNNNGYMRKVGATNTEWPVELAHQMLQDGNGEEKYLIMFSDFYGYVYRGSLTVDNTTYTDVPLSKRTRDWLQGSLSMSTKYDTFAEAYAHKNDEENQTPDGFFRDSSWSDYWTIYQGLDQAPDNDIVDEFQVEMGTFSGFEKSLCMTFDALTEAAADTQVILVHNSYPFGDGKNVQPMTEEMLDQLDKYDSVKLYRHNAKTPEDIEVDVLDKIQEDLVQLVDDGSIVIDEIGEGTDNQGNTYDFAFVSDSAELIVGGEQLKKTPIGDNSYAFGTETDPQFVLTYHPFGTTTEQGTFGECLVWEINTAVTKDQPVQLIYSVELTHPQTNPGTYGVYDADGSDNNTSLLTNLSATLYPVDSNDNEGVPETFAKPTVSYTIADPTITVTFLPGDHGTLRNAQEDGTVSYDDIEKGTGLGDKSVPRVDEDNDWDFTNWLCTGGADGMKNNTYTAEQIAGLKFEQDTVFVAQYEEEPTGGGAQHPDADDDDDDNDRDDNDDTEEIIEEEVPLADTPWLNTEDHYAYIVGYAEDGTVRPNANITRAEVATIFFRLLTDNARDQFWMTTNNFSDVAADAWYNNAVSTMVNMGIIQGYEDGTFRPNANITRAEFAAIAARFMASGYGVEDDLFTDIANHWARESINDAAMAGWINGYEDGTFRPDAAITRAEAVTLVNNVLQRKPDADHMLDSMIKWPDNPEGTWYYEAIQEATNSHDYDLFEDAEYETWTALQENRDWAALEQDWTNAHMN